MGSITRNFANFIGSGGVLQTGALTNGIFDDNKIVNDLSTLGLRVHTQENLSASNTNSQYVDVFQDDTGIDTETNTDRDTNEFVSSKITSTDTETVFYLDSTTNATTPPVVKDASGSGYTVTDGGGLVSESGNVGTYAVRWGGATNDWYRLPHSTSLNLDGDFCIDYFVKFYSQSGSDRILSKVANGPNYSYYLRPQGQLQITSRGGSNNETLSNNVWYYMAYDVDGSNLNVYVDGTRTQQVALSGTTSTTNTADLTFGGAWGDAAGNVQFPNCAIEGFRLKKGSSRYSSASSISVPTQALTNTIETVNATANFTSTAISTADSSTISSAGAVITYQDQAGTNALNTDIILQISADNGSNYTTATLTALPDFSSGIKMAKVNDLTIGTPGTQLKYKISFANQSSGVKEARIRGVSLNY